MSIDYAGFRAEIEKLYTDVVSIYRQESTKINGETVQTPILIYDGQACRISQKSLGQNDQTEAQNQIQYESKIFIAPELEIKQGDLLQLSTRGINLRKYEAGEPFLYETHQEISLQRKEWA